MTLRPVHPSHAWDGFRCSACGSTTMSLDLAMRCVAPASAFWLGNSPPVGEAAMKRDTAEEVADFHRRKQQPDADDRANWDGVLLP